MAEILAWRVPHCLLECGLEPIPYTRAIIVRRGIDVFGWPKTRIAALTALKQKVMDRATSSVADIDAEIAKEEAGHDQTG